MHPFRRHPLAWGGALLLVLTAVAYAPALLGGFVWDDDVLLTRNPLISAADGLSRFWFTQQAPDYWPLTSTSFWAEWRLWGPNPAGYHAVNLALHAGSALLLWAVLRRLALPGAFLAALLFALHPVNVESVAWIAQRKNLLALLFSLAAVYAYRDGASWRAYFGSLLCFVLALLSKSSVAPLPLVLLGTVAWRRRLVRGDLLRLLPFMAAAAALVTAEVLLQHRGTGATVRTAGGPERLAAAGTAFWFYLGKAVAPVRLSFLYPQWPWHPAHLAAWLPLGAALAGAAALGRASHLRGVRYAAAYYAVMLAPALGFVDVHFMRYSLVADHYQHLALIGVVALAAVGWSAWAAQAKTPLPRVTAVATLTILGVLTWRQCQTYRNAATLYRSALARNPDAWLARNNLGELLHRQGRLPEAIDDFRRAIQLQPDFPEAHINLGNALLQSGRIPEAASQFEIAVRLAPDSAEAQNNLGNLLFQTGQAAAAIPHYEAALRVNPDHAEAHNGLGNALLRSQRLPEAIAQYEEAVRLRPSYANARFDLGAALLASGRAAEAADQFQAVLRLHPDDDDARVNLRRAQFEQELNAPAGSRR
jgi:tetratricopeptide (TPR) repeat protein